MGPAGRHGSSEGIADGQEPSSLIRELQLEPAVHLTAESLQQLTETLQDPAGDDEEKLSNTTPAGYTYLSQFIAHDISFDPRPVSAELQTGKNIISWRIDLDSIYGRGPEVDRYFYQDDDRQKLRLTDNPKFAHDLPRVGRTALISDPRNDDNLIVSQLTLLFMQFHNLMIERIRERVPAEALFHRAKREVISVFRSIVKEDLLDRITNASAEDNWVAEGQQRELLLVMFQYAAFRLHSMVRASYRPNVRHIPELLREFLGRTGFGSLLIHDPGAGRSYLQLDWAIDWDLFFETSALCQKARRFSCRPIDSLSIVGGASGSVPVAIRTLQRGQAVGLPSAQALIRYLNGVTGTNLSILTQDEIGESLPPSFAQRNEFTKQTPLWFYLMLEAEYWGGEKLGPLGSLIVRQVLGWVSRPEMCSPTNPSSATTSSATEISTMVELIQYVRAHQQG